MDETNIIDEKLIHSLDTDGGDAKSIDELLIRLKGGDKFALKDLYYGLHKQIYFLALAILRNKPDAEDTVQNTFLAINGNIDKYRGTTSGKNWVLTVARNKALDLYRSNNRISKLEVTNLIAFPDEYEEEYSDIFEKVMLDLNTTERQIVIMHLMMDLTHKDISGITKIPEGSVRRKYASAINKLKDLYKDKEIFFG